MQKDLDSQAHEPLRVEQKGALALITLDRVRALNALNYDMRETLSNVFPTFARDPEIYAVAIRSNSEKAFSVGADVREIIVTAKKDLQRARDGFKDEYSLNWLLECFSKPTISFIDGMVIGSGVGISAYGTHRVAGEKYRFAMPETAIGLFPDVGVAHVLARLPGDMGTFLGLTGARIERADAYHLGLVTHCIPQSQFDEIVDGLADAQPVDPLLDDRHQDPGPAKLMQKASVIERCFEGDSVAQIINRLSEVAGKDRDWAQGIIADLKSRSPLSLAITLRHLRRARDMDLRETLQVDYRLAYRFLDDHDFYEGVRAALIDKDGKPNWKPNNNDDVTDATIDAYFEHLGEAEMILPSRAEMQAARV